MWPPPFREFFVWIGTLPGGLRSRRRAGFRDVPDSVLSLCLFLGLVFVDLRLLACASHTPISQIQKRCSRGSWSAQS
jgi:hypothetical protein